VRIKIKGRRGRGQEEAESHGNCLSHTHTTNSQTSLSSSSVDLISNASALSPRHSPCWVSALCARSHGYLLCARVEHPSSKIPFLLDRRDSRSHFAFSHLIQILNQEVYFIPSTVHKTKLS